MKKFVELPLVDPIYGTYHNQGNATAACAANPSIRNWYLNNVMNLTCERRFLRGYTTPEIDILNSDWVKNPHYERYWFHMRFLKGYTHKVIREFLDQGFYVVFNGIDDYYVDGKSFYKERHFKHDGMICGYNQEEKTYCIYAYDQKWIYQKFWTPQKSFEAGRKAMFKKGHYDLICGIKPKDVNVEIDCGLIIKNLKEYLDSSMEKYPQNEDGKVYGIVVHDYISMYLNRIYTGEVPRERIDHRILRLIWEHKRAMLERIEKVEEELKLGSKFSDEYKEVLAEADKMRMIYAAYHLRAKKSALLLVCEKILDIKNREKEILHEFILKAERVMSNNALETN